MNVTIRPTAIDDKETGAFIGEGFGKFAARNEVVLNYEDFCFTAEDDDKNIIGAITGRAYYNEVHIDDLIIDESARGHGIGKMLVATVEATYREKGYDITLTTFGFQAPGFYRKLGYTLEFVREDSDPKISKYFFIKML